MTGSDRMSLADSREYLHGILEGAKARRSRGIAVGTMESNTIVLDALEQTCRELLAKNELLQRDRAEALSATLGALSKPFISSVSGSTDSSTTDTCSEKEKEKEKDKKCKDRDGDRKKDKDCDEKKK
jgi:hypothetical protein